MKINSDNKQRIHDVLISDLQRRLFKQYNSRTNEFSTDEDYDRVQSMLVDSVLHTNTISDINDVVIEYGELFKESYDSEDIFTLEGTMNYVLNLALEYYTRFKHKDLYRPEFN